MNYLIFDTETTGVPRDYNAPMTNVNNWPRMIQLSFIHFNDAGDDIMKFNALIKPDGWTMPTGDFWKEHGFSQEKSEREGVPVSVAIDQFIDRVNFSDMMIAHNMNFDYNIIGAEMIRLNMRANKRPARICTMLRTVDFCQLPGKYGYKWPKLEELHMKLFGETFDGAHDALADTMHVNDASWNWSNAVLSTHD
jgi:DNA polymerase III epsilon subunit-like protein